MAILVARTNLPVWDFQKLASLVVTLCLENEPSAVHAVCMLENPLYDVATDVIAVINSLCEVTDSLNSSSADTSRVIFINSNMQHDSFVCQNKIIIMLPFIKCRKHWYINSFSSTSSTNFLTSFLFSSIHLWTNHKP